MQSLVMPHLLFRHLLSRLRHARDRMVWGRAGAYQRNADTTWLLCEIMDGPSPRTTPWYAPWWLLQGVTPPVFPDKAPPFLGEASGILWVGDGPMRGLMRVTVQAGSYPLPLDVLQLPGAGMFRLTLDHPRSDRLETRPSANMPDSAEGLNATAVVLQICG